MNDSKGLAVILAIAVPLLVLLILLFSFYLPKMDVRTSIDTQYQFSKDRFRAEVALNNVLRSREPGERSLMDKITYLDTARSRATETEIEEQARQVLSKHTSSDQFYFVVKDTGIEVGEKRGEYLQSETYVSTPSGSRTVMVAIGD